MRTQAFSAIAEKLAETPKIVEEDARAVEQDLVMEHLELLWDPTEDPPEPKFMGDLVKGKVDTFPSQLAREVRPRIEDIAREELQCVARTPEEYVTMVTRIRLRVDLSNKEEMCKMVVGEVYQPMCPVI